MPHNATDGDSLLDILLQATGALVHQNSDGTSAAVHGAAELYLAEFRDKVREPQGNREVTAMQRPRNRTVTVM